MDTDIHIKGCGGASIVVLSLWSENSAKLAVFYVHGYLFGFAQIRQNSFVFVRRAHAQFAQAWLRPSLRTVSRSLPAPGSSATDLGV